MPPRVGRDQIISIINRLAARIANHNHKGSLSSFSEPSAREDAGLDETASNGLEQLVGIKHLGNRFGQRRHHLKPLIFEPEYAGFDRLENLPLPPGAARSRTGQALAGMAFRPPKESSMSKGRKELRKGKSVQEVFILKGRKTRRPPASKFRTKAKGRPSRSRIGTSTPGPTFWMIPNRWIAERYKSRAALPSKTSFSKELSSRALIRKGFPNRTAPPATRRNLNENRSASRITEAVFAKGCPGVKMAVPPPSTKSRRAAPSSCSSNQSPKPMTRSSSRPDFSASNLKPSA